MNQTLLNHALALFIPITTGYGVLPQNSYFGYTGRSNRLTYKQKAEDYFPRIPHESNSVRDTPSQNIEPVLDSDISLQQGYNVSELVIIDNTVPNKHTFYELNKPHVSIIELPADGDSLQHMMDILSRYQNLDALHIVSHASSGVLYLGGQYIDAQELSNNINIFTQLNKTLKPGADLLFYGCNLAADKNGEDFLTLIKSETHIDVAASSNLTGSAKHSGNWELEIKKGDIEASLPFSDAALQDFRGVLAIIPGGSSNNNGEYGGAATVDALYDYAGATFVFDGSSVGTAIQGGYLYVGSNLSGLLNETSLTISVDGGGTFDISSFYFAGLAAVNLTVTSPEGDSQSALSIVPGQINLTGFDNISALTITPLTGFVGALRDFNISNVITPNADGTVTAGAGVEASTLGTTLDSVGEAVDVFDFTITDGGSSDGAALAVSSITVNVSGTASDTQRSNITWQLDGPDTTLLTGVYSAVSDTLTFSGLAISVANNTSETYTISAFYNDNSNVSDGSTIVLSVDGDTDFTVVGTGTQMGTTASVSNGSGLAASVIATQLDVITQPAGSVSGATLTTQPVIAAHDDFGNTDTDFSEVITLTESSLGTLTNNTATAVSGQATFSGLTYTATADQQAFILTADDAPTGSDLSSAVTNAVVSDVVATQLTFTTQPAPLTLQANTITSLTTLPIVQAQDTEGVLDTGFTDDIVLSETNGAGTVLLSGVGDTDANNATITLAPIAGVAVFTGTQITYTASGGSDETFNLSASSTGVSASISAQLTAGAFNTDGTVTPSAAISEPVSIPTTADSAAEAISIFDFTMTDGGGGDNRAFTVTAIDVQTTGSTIPPDKLSYQLNGNDVNGAIGTVDSNGVITFTGLSISVDDGQSETYTIRAFFTDNTNLAEGQVLNLSTDVDTDFTLAGGSTLVTPSPAVTNGSGSAADVSATTLNYVIGPAGVISGTTFSTQPMIAAQDSFGNTDADFVGDITLSETSAGNLDGTLTATAIAGEATFTDVSYVATADQQSVTLTAAESALGLSSASVNLVADVVATRLVFDTSPTLPNVNVGIDTDDPALPFIGLDNTFTTVPVVSGRDNNGLLDIDFTANVTLFEGVNNAGSATILSATNDTDADTSTVTQTTINGSTTFTNLIFNYTANSAIDSVRFDATDDSGITSNAIGSTIGDVNVTPIVLESPNTFGPFTITEDVRTALDTSDLDIQDADADEISITLTLNRGLLFALDGDGTKDDVTTSGSNGSSGSQSITLSGLPNRLNTFFDNSPFEFQSEANDTMPSTLTVTVSDGKIEGTQLQEAINITPVNDTPVISGIPPTTIDEGNAYNFVPTANDVEGDLLTFSIMNKPSWANFDSNTGALTGTPLSDDVGVTDAIVIRVTDPSLASDNLPSFSISVNSTNTPPTITGIPSTSIDEDSTYTFTPTATDPDDDTLTFSITNAPAWATFNTASGALTGTPDNEDIGTTSGIVISVTDGIETTSLAAFDIVVVNVNDAPSISGTPSSSAVQGESYAFIPTAMDPDDDTLTFSITNAPTWATFNTTSGALTGTPDKEDIGTTSGIAISVTDGIETTSLTAFDITVVNVNDAPTITGVPSTSVDEDSTYTFTPTATDPDDDTLTFSITNAPTWATFNTTSGALTGTPDNEDV